MIELRIEDQPAAVSDLWEQVRQLVSGLPPGWVLVGGLMVQLHVIEAGSDAVRITTDIDLLGQARDPAALPALAKALEDMDFKLGPPDLDGYSHRFERDGVVVDLLAPDGLNRRISVIGNTSTVGIPGGSQALTRAEQVRVQTDGGAFSLLRPSLLGAILIKARSVRVHRDPDAQLLDLISLLALAEDPATMSKELRGGERKWLRAIRDRVDEAPPELADAPTVERARLALALLVPDG